MNFPYTVTFQSEAKVVTPREEDEFLALASLENLKGVLPDAPESPDLLYIASDLFVAGMANANGHALSIEDSIQLAPNFINKFLDIEHKRNKITGVILNYAFTEFGSSKIIEDINGYDKPFNIAYGAAVWKLLYPNLIEYLINSSDPSSDKYKSISSSWEVGFKNFDIAVGSRIVSECEIISDEKKKKELIPFTKKGGGDGKKDGEYVFYLVRPPVLGMGAGLVASPAAQVKGVLVDIDLEESDDESEEDVASVNKKQENTEINQENCVNNSTITMKTLKELYQLLAQEKGDEVSASAQSLIEKSILEANQVWEAKQAELESQRQEAIAKQEQAENDAKELKATLEGIQTELASVKETLETYKQAEAAREAEERFNARMLQLDEAYNLDDDARKAIVSYVRDLEDEAYASWTNDFLAVILRGKEKTEEADASVEESTASDESEASEEEVIDEALASVSSSEDAPLNPDSHEKSLRDQMKEAFGSDAFEFTTK